MRVFISSRMFYAGPLLQCRWESHHAGWASQASRLSWPVGPMDKAVGDHDMCLVSDVTWHPVRCVRVRLYTLGWLWCWFFTCKVFWKRIVTSILQHTYYTLQYHERRNKQIIVTPFSWSSKWFECQRFVTTPQATSQLYLLVKHMIHKSSYYECQQHSQTAYPWIY